MKKDSLIRQIYLYLFTIVGLFLVIIPAVDFLDMAMRATIFKQADEETRYWQNQPPTPVLDTMKLQTMTEQQTANGAEKTLTDAELAQIRSWLVDYDAWKKQREAFDPITAQRQRDASRNISMLLVGIPLYLYHWSIIKKENREKKEENA